MSVNSLEIARDRPRSRSRGMPRMRFQAEESAPPVEDIQNPARIPPSRVHGWGERSFRLPNQPAQAPPPGPRRVAARCPRSRSRPEMKESRWRRHCPRAPRLAKNLDGVMIDISSRRPHRVHVHQLARDRPRSPEIAISPRDEGRVGGGGAALAPHASPKPRRRDDRHQLTQTPSSPCPTSRPRSPEIARDRDLAQR